MLMMFFIIQGIDPPASSETSRALLPVPGPERDGCHSLELVGAS